MPRNPLTVRVPEPWFAAIDKRRGKRTLSEYVRDLIRHDIPKALPEPRQPGRPKNE